MSSTLVEQEKKVYEDATVEQEDQGDQGLSSQELSAHESASTYEGEPVAATQSPFPKAPDGGFHAWLKVFGGFMIYINIWSVYAFLLSVAFKVKD